MNHLSSIFRSGSNLIWSQVKSYGWVYFFFIINCFSCWSKHLYICFLIFCLNNGQKVWESSFRWWESGKPHVTHPWESDFWKNAVSPGYCIILMKVKGKLSIWDEGFGIYDKQLLFCLFILLLVIQMSELMDGIIIVINIIHLIAWGSNALCYKALKTRTCILAENETYCNMCNIVVYVLDKQFSMFQ